MLPNITGGGCLIAQLLALLDFVGSVLKFGVEVGKKDIYQHIGSHG